MKKYKVRFSILNLLSDSSKEVVKLQGIWKAITGAVTGTVWFESNATYALIVMISGAVVNEAIACLYFQEIKPKTDAID